MKGTWRAVPCKQALITCCNLSRHSLLSTSNAPGQRGRGMEGWEMGGKQNRERREREDVRERGEWGQNKLWPRPLPPSLPHLLFSLIRSFLYICVLFFFSFCISLFYFSQLCIHPLFSIPPSTLPPSPPPSLSLPQPVFSSIAFPSFCSPHFHPVQTSLCVNGPDRAGPCVFFPPFIGLRCSWRCAIRQLCAGFQRSADASGGKPRLSVTMPPPVGPCEYSSPQHVVQRWDVEIKWRFNTLIGGFVWLHSWNWSLFKTMICVLTFLLYLFISSMFIWLFMDTCFNVGLVFARAWFTVGVVNSHDIIKPIHFIKLFKLNICIKSIDSKSRHISTVSVAACGHDEHVHTSNMHHVWADNKRTSPSPKNVSWLTTCDWTSLPRRYSQ